jgi:hypothetical protein
VSWSVWHKKRNGAVDLEIQQGSLTGEPSLAGYCAIVLQAEAKRKSEPGYAVATQGQDTVLISRNPLTIKHLWRLEISQLMP